MEDLDLYRENIWDSYKPGRVKGLKERFLSLTETGQVNASRTELSYVYTVPHLNIYTKRDAPKTINKSKWNGNGWDGKPISGSQESGVVAGEGDGCAIKK